MTQRHLNHSRGHGRLITVMSDGKQLALNKILTNQAIQAYSLVHIPYVQVTVVGNDTNCIQLNVLMHHTNMKNKHGYNVFQIFLMYQCTGSETKIYILSLKWILDACYHLTYCILFTCITDLLGAQLMCSFSIEVFKNVTVR